MKAGCGHGLIRLATGCVKERDGFVHAVWHGSPVLDLSPISDPDDFSLKAHLVPVETLS